MVIWLLICCLGSGWLVTVPPKDYPKQVVQNPFKGDDLKAKCPDGIADNHPEWVVSAELC